MARQLTHNIILRQLKNWDFNMTLDESSFGKMLFSKLEETQNIVTISRWAYNIFLDYQDACSPELRSLLLDLTRMEDGQEFEFSIAELQKIAADLARQNKNDVSP